MPNKKIHHCFVDESGDLNLFNKRGKVIIGYEGVSRFFMVGVASLPDPIEAQLKFDNLRKELLADLYFRNVPSMKHSAKKTALYFHAKDDLPEVRREVYKLLITFGAKVQIALRRKEVLLEQARIASRIGQGMNRGKIYNSLVSRLFRNMLHKADENQIVFSRRGKSTSAQALSEAIRKAKRNFEIKTGMQSNKPTKIVSAHPSQYAGLQVVDYYLWAVQRLYEKGEDRYFHFLGEDYKLIMDLDDKRNNEYGEWYSKSNPLTLNKISPQTD